MEADYESCQLMQNEEMNCGKDAEAVHHNSLVLNSSAAVMLIDWLVDISLVSQQLRLSKAVREMTCRSSWNAMQCSKAGMITSIVRCLRQCSSSRLHVSVVGECYVSGQVVF